MFSKHVGTKDSDEVKVLIILEAVRISLSSFNGTLVMESVSSSAIYWVTSPSERL